jgi:hypothetical protein
MTGNTKPNGDETGPAPGKTLARAAASVMTQAGAATEAPAAKDKAEPAVVPPADNPATPRDEFHGFGGMFVMLDGKRVPCDDAGKPLPATK